MWILENKKQALTNGFTCFTSGKTIYVQSNFCRQKLDFTKFDWSKQVKN